MHTPPSFRCPWCTRVSYNPQDVERQYCGHCHAFPLDSAVSEFLAGVELSIEALSPTQEVPAEVRERFRQHVARRSGPEATAGGADTVSG